MSSPYLAEISNLYVALFGRAPDTEGLGYWSGLRVAGEDLAHVADTMFATSPARAYFPSYLSSTQIVASFPAALDEPAFLLGAWWCHAGGPSCEADDEDCPLLGACPQNRTAWEIRG